MRQFLLNCHPRTFLPKFRNRMHQLHLNVTRTHFYRILETGGIKFR